MQLDKSISNTLKQLPHDKTLKAVADIGISIKETDGSLKAVSKVINEIGRLEIDGTKVRNSNY